MPGPRAIACLLLLAGPVTAHAARSAPVATAHATAQLLTDTDTIAAGATIHAALALTPAPGWHTYWHNPGQAGAAPEFTLDAGAATVDGIAWPLPERLVDHGIVSFVYRGRVLLSRPVHATTNDPLTVVATARWLVCKDICVPEAARLALTLPAGKPVLSADQPIFAATAARIPTPAPWPGHIAPDGTLWLRHTWPAGPLHFLPDMSDAIVLAAPQPLSRIGDILALHLTPAPQFRPDHPLTGVLVAGEGSAERGFRLAATPAALPAQAAADGWTLVLLALAGGLLLNVMPCVFPVLAMKAMSLAALGGAGRAAARRHALAYVAGVLASFAALAGALLLMRAGGAAVGWGFQLQYPPFVAGLAWLFFALGLNLSGAVPLGPGWSGVGQRWAAGRGLAGSAATGLLAVLVATPCTAPFMGAAVAAAAIAPAPVTIAVCLALGLGFALPWLLIATAPPLAHWLPRPGAWMERLRQALAFPMYATALWLLWVEAGQTGAFGVARVGAGFLLIGVALWLATQARALSRIARGLLAALAIGCAGAAAALLPGLARAPVPAAASALAQMKFSPAILVQLRHGGQPVLVNMTAAWCVTCLLNETLAIQPSLPDLAAHNVAYLTGDWTRQDAAITRFLRQYGRDGVPLYVFFPANAPDAAPGRVLPQILTPRLLHALTVGAAG